MFNLLITLFGAPSATADWKRKADQGSAQFQWFDTGQAVAGVNLVSGLAAEIALSQRL